MSLKNVAVHVPTRPHVCSRRSSMFVVFFCCWSSLDGERRLLLQCIHIIDRMSPRSFMRPQSRTANVDSRKKRAARVSAPPSAVANPPNCFRCALKCCLFTSFLRQQDWQLDRALILGPGMQTSSSCHRHHVIAELAAKFQMLITQTWSRNQDVLLVLGSSVCQNLRIAA